LAVFGFVSGEPLASVVEALVRAVEVGAGGVDLSTSSGELAVCDPVGAFELGPAATGERPPGVERLELRAGAVLGCAGGISGREGLAVRSGGLIGVLLVALELAALEGHVEVVDVPELVGDMAQHGQGQLDRRHRSGTGAAGEPLLVGDGGGVDPVPADRVGEDVAWAAGVVGLEGDVGVVRVPATGEGDVDAAVVDGALTRSSEWSTVRPWAACPVCA
jgi:hypothetical protein